MAGKRSVEWKIWIKRSRGNFNRQTNQGWSWRLRWTENMGPMHGDRIDLRPKNWTWSKGSGTRLHLATQPRSSGDDQEGNLSLGKACLHRWPRPKSGNTKEPFIFKDTPIIRSWFEIEGMQLSAGSKVSSRFPFSPMISHNCWIQPWL